MSSSRQRRTCKLRLEELESRLVPAGNIHTIQHIINIVMENRSFDQYFGTYPGADGIPAGVKVPDPATGGFQSPYYDPNNVDVGGPHANNNALADLNNGKMNGFVAQVEQDPNYQGVPVDVMGYHDYHQIPNYWSYAQHFVLMDHLFSPVLSWSMPAHDYIVSAWSAVSSNPYDPMSSVNDVNTFYPPQNLTGPINAWTDITYLFNKAGVSWAYYSFKGSVPEDPDQRGPQAAAFQQPTQIIWNPLQLFTDVWTDGQLGNLQDVSKFYTAVQNGTLPNVSWIAPDDARSEHPFPHKNVLISDGQAWVTNLINTVMKSSLWDSTAIFLYWDDWGGFYDHAVPPKVDQNGYGFRVPGMIISPWVKPGLIDSQTLSFDAFLKFAEDDFLSGQRLDPATDGRPDPRPDVRENAAILGNLLNDFDFNQTPLPPLILPEYPTVPTGNPGGAYTIVEGNSLTLDASNSTSPDGKPLTYQWDLQGDIYSFHTYTAGDGANPTLTWAQLQSLGVTARARPYYVSVFTGEKEAGSGYYSLSPFTTLQVFDAPLSATAHSIAQTEEAAFSGIVASFTDPGSDGTTTLYTAQINWGDGHVTAGTVSIDSQGRFNVFGLNTYARDGSYTVTVTIRDDGGASVTVHTTAVIQDAPLTAASRSITATVGSAFSGVVAVFRDPGSDGDLSEYHAQINWGDGHTSAGSVALDPHGGFDVIGTNTFAAAGSYTVNVDIADDVSTAQVKDTALVLLPYLVTAADSGGGPNVRIFNRSTGTLLGEIMAYDPAFLGGVRVAVGQVGGGPDPDIVTAPGPSGGPDIRVYDVMTGGLIAEFMAYNPGFLGGVYVAVADFNGDGYADIITGADAGGGPEVKVFDGKSLVTQGKVVTLADFYAYNPAFNGGVRVAAADVDHDGIPDLVAAPGAGGGPDVRVFGGARLDTANPTGDIIREFMAYNADFSGGVYVAAADVNGDGYADIITGAGTGTPVGPQVGIWSGKDLSLLQSIEPYPAGFTGGVRVGAVADAEGIGKADIITGAGPGGGPQVLVFNGLDLTVLDNFYAYDATFSGGVFVGGQ
jgi:phospholipase C